MEDTNNLRRALSNLVGNVHMWEQRLADAGCEPEVFREAVPEMRNALNSVGRAGFRQLAQARETSADTLILDYGLLPPGAYLGVSTHQCNPTPEKEKTHAILHRPAPAQLRCRSARAHHVPMHPQPRRRDLAPPEYQG